MCKLMLMKLSSIHCACKSKKLLFLTKHPVECFITDVTGIVCSTNEDNIYYKPLVFSGLALGQHMCKDNI